MQAVKADRKLKPPKTEWQGATIRNSHTLCNNLLPVWAPAQTEMDYFARANEYWSENTLISLGMPYSGSCVNLVSIFWLRISADGPVSFFFCF